jgi:hypothetical protein
MILFDKLKEKVSKKTESMETQIVDGVVSNLVPAIKHRTILGDILENPEAFKLEIWFDNNELNAKIKPREKVYVLTKEQYEYLMKNS